MDFKKSVFSVFSPKKGETDCHLRGFRHVCTRAHSSSVGAIMQVGGTHPARPQCCAGQGGAAASTRPGLTENRASAEQGRGLAIRSRQMPHGHEQVTPECAGHSPVPEGHTACGPGTLVGTCLWTGRPRTPGTEGTGGERGFRRRARRSILPQGRSVAVPAGLVSAVVRSRQRGPRQEAAPGGEGCMPSGRAGTEAQTPARQMPMACRTRLSLSLRWPENTA